MSIIDELTVGVKFTAIWRGERYRFRVAEKFNIGDHWMCHEVDGNLPNRVYGTHELSEFVVQPSQ